MIKEYLFKVTKEQYIKVGATNKEDAYERAEENSLIDTSDEEVTDIELIDVYDEDVDAIYDDYKLGMYDTDEEDMLETINYFLGNTPIVCICADYGDFTDVMAVDVNMNVDDVVDTYITPLLYDIGALSDGDSDTLSYLVNHSILTSSDGIDINGVKIYMTEIPKSLYDTMEEV